MLCITKQFQNFSSFLHFRSDKTYRAWGRFLWRKSSKTSVQFLLSSAKYDTINLERGVAVVVSALCCSRLQDKLSQPQHIVEHQSRPLLLVSFWLGVVLLVTDTNDLQLDPAATPTPTSTRSKRIEELKSTIATQDQTISTLQTQYSNLRTSNESYIDSLTDSHSAEVASLRNQVRVLEEQLARRPLHHSTSRLPVFLNPLSPQSNTAVAHWLVRCAARSRRTPVTVNTDTN